MRPVPRADAYPSPRSGHQATNLQAERDVVLAAVASNGLALESAAQNLRGNAEVVLTAARSTAGAAALPYADPSFWTRKAEALAAVRAAPFALEHAGPWRAVRAVVLPTPATDHGKKHSGMRKKEYARPHLGAR